MHGIMYERGVTEGQNQCDTGSKCSFCKEIWKFFIKADGCCFRKEVYIGFSTDESPVACSMADGKLRARVHIR